MKGCPRTIRPPADALTAMLLSAFAALAVACAPTVGPPGPSAMRGQQPYSVNGIHYYPIPSARGFSQAGTASWYGEPFHGRPTSSGEIYDMHRMTAAHKTLPLGTHVKVTRIDTGDSLIVRINDRGPFVKNRIIDLSHAAARQLGFAQQGTAPVHIAAVLAATPAVREGHQHWHTETIPDFQHGLFTIQAGAFGERCNAARLQAALTAAGYEAHIIKPQSDNVPVLYRVQLHTFTDLIQAHLTAAQLEQQGFAHLFVIAVEDRPMPAGLPHHD